MYAQRTKSEETKKPEGGGREEEEGRWGCGREKLKSTVRTPARFCRPRLRDAPRPLSAV